MNSQHSMNTAVSHDSLVNTGIVLMLMCQGIAWAEVQFVPHANTTYEYNSNLFLTPDSGAIQPRIDKSGQPRLDDASIAYGGGIDINGRWGENTLALRTNIQRSDHENFSDITRNDRLMSFTYDWIATRKITGTINARYDEHLTPFKEVANPADLANPALDLNKTNLTQIDRLAGFVTNYQANRFWQTAAEFNYGRLTVPIPAVGQLDSYDLQTLYARVGIKFTGFAKAALGLGISGNDGVYINAVNAPPFSSVNYQATLDYVISPKTTLNLNYGYSQYRQDQLNQQERLNSSANVGGAALNHQLTNKVNYFIRYDRTLTYFATTRGSQLGSTTSGGLNYQMLTKVGVTASYGITKAKVDGTPVVGVQPIAREEKTRATQVTLNYGMMRWLNILGYYRYQKRTAEDNPEFNYDGYVWGTTIGVQFQ